MAPLAHLRPAVVQAARGRVLEVGAGTGLNFPFYRAGTRVDAVEPDPWMRRQAKRRAEVAGVTLHDAGAQRMPFPDATFDNVVITFALCTIPETGAALREIARVAKPGAVVHFAEHVRSEVWLLAAAQAWLNPIWTRMAGGCLLDRDPMAAMADAGFHGFAVRQRGSRWSGLPVITGTARTPDAP